MDGPESPQNPAPQEARNWAIVAHLGPIALSLVSLGVLGWMVPLVVWLTQKEAHPFAAQHAKEALNFQIMLVVLFLLTFPILFALICIGVPVWIAIWLLELVLGIIAAFRASDGQLYRYPLTPRFIG